MPWTHASQLQQPTQRAGGITRCSQHGAMLGGLLLLAAAYHAVEAASSTGGAATPAAAVQGIKFQSIPALPGCNSNGATAGAAAAASSSNARALVPELQHCSWSVQMQRQSSRWYAFEVGPESADNMSVVIMARAVSGQITTALWGPGSDPVRSVPTQVGTNYMEWPGLREVDQEEGAAGGGHASLASEQQYLFLSHRSKKPLLVGQYTVVIQADMGQPLVSVEVSTPSSMTQLVAEEQEALKDLVKGCCLGLGQPGSPEALAAEAAAAAGLGSLSGWCSTVGHAVTYDLREWYADICHVAPNTCTSDGHLQRLVLPPYALRCSSFPKALASFSRLRHLDMSYSVAPGHIADVADVVARLPELQQLHLRGIGLSGPLSCELVQAASKLQVLSLSDNGKLSGSLASCWLTHSSLLELQLAGLSDLHGELPDMTQTVSAGSTPECGFGTLRYINMAGIIGDAGLGFTGTLPSALGFCKELLYLDLSGHSLSGSLPALPPAIQFLNLSSNTLRGSLPEFAVDAQLQYLDLSFNRFEGTLQDMTLLPMLDWLDLSDNSLLGPLPPLPPSVRWVDLSHNEFSGDVKLPVAPRHAEHDLALVLYNLAHNRLTGSVPGALGSQTNLAFLDLSHNQLSGTLHEFATALWTRNNLLQFNLSYNQLTGDIPAQLQHLAAVRPVLVTMKDGLTPVTRIFDVSHNRMSGVFPAWLITNIPLLLSSCHCGVGVNLDSVAFTCPAALPRLSREAQAALRHFDFLYCMVDSSSGDGGGSGSDGSGTAVGRTSGGQQQEQMPIWKVAAGSAGRHGMMSRAEHKAMMQRHWDEEQQQDRYAAGAGAQVAEGVRQRKRAAIAGIVLAVVAAVALAAVGVLAVLRTHRVSWWGNEGPQHHLDYKGHGYTRLPDFQAYHPPAFSDAQSQSPHASDGSDSPYSPYAQSSSPMSGGSPTARSIGNGSIGSGSSSGSGSGSGSSSGSRTSRASCTGDGLVEIALVLRPSSAGGVQDSGAGCGNLGCHTSCGQASTDKDKDHDGA